MKEKKNKKILFPIFILLVTIFMGIGYTSINSISIGIGGEIIAKEVDGIYITEAKYVSDVNADVSSSKILNAYQTNLNSRIVLSNTDPNSSITYEVTIYNSLSEDYAFDEVSYLVSDETYSNEDIVYELNGLTYGDVLKSKQSITFTITFHYKNNIISNNNILNSILNFRFKKFYYVTYENFSSIINYPTIVLEGKTLTVSFGQLDAPIEVKKSDVILSSNNYSYSNYVLTINDVNGAIHIRKLTKYTIYNLVKNGSFEDGLTNWSIIEGTAWHQTSISHFGSKAYYRDPSAQATNYLRQTLSFTNGHKYYFFAYTICTSEQNFYADIGYTSSNITIKSVPNEYRKGSVIYQSDLTGTKYIHINFANTTDAVIVDGIGMVDLTASFGSGNEPDLDWCNENINYFDGSTTVYK